MITSVAVNEVMALFTPRERLALRRLRTRYELDQDRFSAQERARLRFVRWLRETEGMLPGVCQLGRQVNEHPCNQTK